jgi:hypothetical protein
MPFTETDCNSKADWDRVRKIQMLVHVAFGSSNCPGSLKRLPASERSHVTCRVQEENLFIYTRDQNLGLPHKTSTKRFGIPSFNPEVSWFGRAKFTSLECSTRKAFRETGQSFFQTKSLKRSEPKQSSRAAKKCRELLGRFNVHLG